MISLKVAGPASAIVGATLMCGVARAGDANTISGAGARFPYPAYSRWVDSYAKATQIRRNRQAIGSGGGIKQISGWTMELDMRRSDLS